MKRYRRTGAFKKMSRRPNNSGSAEAGKRSAPDKLHKN